MKAVFASLLSLSLLAGSAALAADNEASKAGSSPGAVELLFTQSANAMRYDGETLSLDDIGPATLYFADRPNRLVGLLSNQKFVDLWTEGQDSFAADPPNAALALLGETNKPPVVVELLGVALEGETLNYKVRVLEGDLPKQSGPVTLFIDHHHFHWRGRGWGWGPGFGGWGPGFGPTWDSGFSGSVFGCGMNSYMGTLHACY